MTNQQKSEEFAGQVVADVAAAISGVMTSIGHKLKLYKNMASKGWMSSEQLASNSGLHERYVREWLNNQVAGGYVEYDKSMHLYCLPDAHLPILVDEDSPFFLVPALEVVASLWHDEGKIQQLFTTGEGMAWGDHHHRLFCGSESLFRPGYETFLIDDWIASVPSLQEKLSMGIKVADVGCGHGVSSILLAKAFKKSQIIGYDNHAKSISTANERSQAAGSPKNLSFVCQDAKSYTEKNFDLLCFMDCLHDMGDPVGAARHAYNSLKEGGQIFLVEPAANDCVSDNINPVSRLYYAASTSVCVPCSRSQDVQAGLGAQAGQKRLSDILKEAGFRNVKRVAETAFNIILVASK
ncbi:class I SAM-dependent methyltransferase [Temperatibacter marinus]|uniref:Class I SAM-dependent methyltransferase n=1 Tax=Temperatibacter marinus TaxID=1456591 RepID=A0AA52EDR3_9PROT|nr:class I SAM-dependent methyltransferase [Temperatibacter marinus]WND01798.1 class I SAM-dependent methyltransferase [Temperatibacter marinus]